MANPHPGTPSPRGGKRPGSGRPHIAPGQKTKPFSVLLPAALHQRLYTEKNPRQIADLKTQIRNLITATLEP